MTRLALREAPAADLLARFDESTTVYWRQPAEKLELLGQGTARRITGDAATLRDAAPGARWFCALPFKPGAPGLLLQPETLFVRRGSSTARLDARRGRCVPFDCPAPAGVDEPRESFEARVTRALVEIAAGRLHKVVLARCVQQPLRHTPAELLARLRERHPACAIFCLRLDRLTLFLGATPERLVRLEGRRIHTVAVAGTAPRAADPRALLDSPKERTEHRLVLDQIRRALAPHVETLEAASRPELLRLAGLQHLITPIEALAHPGRHVLELACALHPTPATGGLPREAAHRFLAAHEPLDRGFYAGPLGWCDAVGDGDLWVGLRSGLIHDGTLWAFAGAGIVAGSDPAAEWDETELKLEAMREANR